jgi:two-component system cell cycle sensor histidine kinase/response regulator CckA
MDEDRHPRILLIDDDATVREVVRSLLASLGYHCQTAADGVTGLAWIDEGGWDIVLTDLAMPGMNGWAVADAIRRRSPTMPIVLLTGLTNPEVLRPAEERGLPVVSKPFHAETLRAAMAHALQASATAQATVSDPNIDADANKLDEPFGKLTLRSHPR